MTFNDFKALILNNIKFSTLEIQQFKKLPNHQRIDIFRIACEKEYSERAKELYNYIQIKPDDISPILLTIINDFTHKKPDIIEWLFSFKPILQINIQHRKIIENNPEVLNIIFCNLPINNKMIYHLINHCVLNNKPTSLEWICQNQHKGYLYYHEDMYYHAFYTLFHQGHIYNKNQTLNINPIMDIVYNEIKKNNDNIYQKMLTLIYNIPDLDGIKINNSQHFHIAFKQITSFYLNKKLNEKLLSHSNNPTTKEKRIKI